MSNSQDASRKPHFTTGRRRIDPVRADIQDLAAYLATDTEVGLSHKEAERRWQKREVKALFTGEKPKLKDCILLILKEPVMWLLLVVSVVACIFDHGKIGIPAILLMLLHGGVCVLMEMTTQRFNRQMQAYDVPLARVVRNGRVFRLPADQLLPGDVILLRAGDIIPADARLLTAYRLTVAEDTLDGDASKRETVKLAKDANATPDMIPVRHSPQNMVYAGGLVIEGGGRALVIATGERTHVGGLMGKVPPSHTSYPPKALVETKKKLSLANLIIAVATIPLTAIGILTLGDRYDLLDLFATALALSVITLTEHIVVCGAYIATAVKKAAATQADPYLSCEIRSTETLENLGRMDHLVVMGTSAFHDGVYMPESMLTCGNVYACGQSATDQAVIDFAEKMFLYTEGIKISGGTRSGGGYASCAMLSQATEKLCGWVQPDVEALMLRLSSVTPCDDCVEVVMKHGHPTYITLEEVGGEDVWFDRCDYVRAIANESQVPTLIPMTSEIFNEWLDFVNFSEDQGKRVQVLISETDGVVCAEGLIAVMPETCPKTKGCLSAMEKAGISVTFFMRDVSREHAYYMRDAGVLNGREAPYSLFHDSRSSVVSLTERGVKAFEGCSTKDVLDYIEAVQAKGGVVGVLSADREDHPILMQADIAMTTTAVALKEALVKQTIASVEQAVTTDGLPDGDTATDLCRYSADVVVRRCSRQGGGLCGVRRALLAAEHMKKSSHLICRYIVLSQILRVLMTLLPLLMGLTILSVPVVLFSGFVVDLLAFWCYTHADVPTELTSRSMEKATPKKEPQSKVAALVALIPVSPVQMILVAVSVLIPWVVALVAKLLLVNFGADLGYFGMLSLMASQVALLTTAHLPRHRRVGFFSVVLMVCLYVGCLSVALTAELAVLWSLLLPLAQGLFLFVALKVCGAIEAKHRT